MKSRRRKFWISAAVVAFVVLCVSLIIGFREWARTTDYGGVVHGGRYAPSPSAQTGKDPLAWLIAYPGGAFAQLILWAVLIFLAYEILRGTVHGVRFVWRHTVGRKVEKVEKAVREKEAAAGAWWRTAALLAVSGVLYALAFYPGAYGVTVWFALVPALLAARGAAGRRLFLLSWAAGYAVNLFLFYWIAFVTVPGWLVLPLYLGLYWPVFLGGVELARRRWGVPRAVTAVCLWPLLEFLRGVLFTGLPWFYLGHALYRWPRLIQSADLGGVMLVSTIVVAVNALLAEAAFALRRGRREGAGGTAGQPREGEKGPAAVGEEGPAAGREGEGASSSARAGARPAHRQGPYPAAEGSAVRTEAAEGPSGRAETSAGGGGARLRPAGALALAALVFAANLGYGALRFATLDTREGPEVALVQPNVPQDLKISMDEEEAARILRRLRRYSTGEAAAGADVVFWPETIMPGLVGIEDYTPASGMAGAEILDELRRQGVLSPEEVARVVEAAGESAGFIDALEEVGGEGTAKNLTTYNMLSASAALVEKPLVAGAMAAELGEDGRVARTYNRACHFAPSGYERSHYDKVHLVPFGEFVPFRESWPWAASLIGSIMPLRPGIYAGERFVVFEEAGVGWGPSICFEDTFGYVGREYRRRGAQVLVNLTNDGWFKRSFELEAHLANALLRTVETRMALVRAANTGISAVVSPRGEVTARLVVEGRERAVGGVLVAPVELCGSGTLYVLWGDWWLAVPLLVPGGFVVVRGGRGA